MFSSCIIFAFRSVVVILHVNEAMSGLMQVVVSRCLGEERCCYINSGAGKKDLLHILLVPPGMLTAFEEDVLNPCGIYCLYLYGHICSSK